MCVSKKLPPTPFSHAHSALLVDASRNTARQVSLRHDHAKENVRIDSGTFLRVLTDCNPCVLQGNVYVKCPSIAAAIAAVNALHGRWFAGEWISRRHLHLLIHYRNDQVLIFNLFFFIFWLGKMITAAYVPLPTYHSLFPDSMTATQLLVPVRRWRWI